MDRRRFALTAVLFVALATLVILVLNPPLWLVSTDTYGNATVTAVDADGTTLATVDVRIANTTSQHRVGLSRTDSMPPDGGMLFVFESERSQPFVMRNMSFPLDIVFVAANGTVTTIHHAPVPAATPEDDLRRYPGRGKWVLEVNRGWANRTGLDVGDRIEIPSHVGS
jgi:uncharacterized membrane protein (UPF0127 family)